MRAIYFFSYGKIVCRKLINSISHVLPWYVLLCYFVIPHTPSSYKIHLHPFLLAMQNWKGNTHILRPSLPTHCLWWAQFYWSHQRWSKFCRVKTRMRLVIIYQRTFECGIILLCQLWARYRPFVTTPWYTTSTIQRKNKTRFASCRNRPFHIYAFPIVNKFLLDSSNLSYILQNIRLWTTWYDWS